MTDEDFSEFIQLLISARVLAARYKGNIVAIEVDASAYDSLMAGASKKDGLNVPPEQDYLNVKAHQRAIEGGRILGVTIKVAPDTLTES